MASFIFLDFLHEAAQRNAQEIYIIPGSPMHIRINGKMVKAGETLMPKDTDGILREIYTLAKRRIDDSILKNGDDNFSFTLPGVSRFRVSLFRQRNSCGCIMRSIGFSFPSEEELRLTPEVMNAANFSDGLVLAAGYAGSGKSTTLAALIRRINRTRAGKVIVTLENPLEYLHSHDRSIVIQREIYTDTVDYITGIQSAMYQRPDLLMISDLPTADVVRQAIRAAFSGQLIYSTVYGNSAADAIAGMLTMFSFDEQKIICGQLARILRMVIFQRMVPGIDGRYIPVFETVEIDSALRMLLQANDMQGFRDTIAHAKVSGTVSFDHNLVSCYRKQLISYNTAVEYAMDKASVRRLIH